MESDILVTMFHTILCHCMYVSSKAVGGPKLSLNFQCTFGPKTAFSLPGLTVCVGGKHV